MLFGKTGAHKQLLAHKTMALCTLTLPYVLLQPVEIPINWLALQLSTQPATQWRSGGPNPWAYSTAGPLHLPHMSTHLRQATVEQKKHYMQRCGGCTMHINPLLPPCGTPQKKTPMLETYALCSRRFIR